MLRLLMPHPALPPGTWAADVSMGEAESNVARSSAPARFTLQLTIYEKPRFSPRIGQIDGMQRHSSALIGSLGIIVAYVLIRSCVYHFFPVTSQETWFFRDTLMSIPRLGAFATLVLLNRFWHAARFDLPFKDFGRVALLGLVPVALWVFYFSGGQGGIFTPFKRFVGFFTSLVVGVFEEYAFRGPLLFALRQRLSLLSTVVLSSVLFAIYHVQAQPLRSWVAIFLTGVIYANLRFRGLSLGWLAVIHGVTDAFFFAFPDMNPSMFGFYGLVLQTGLLAYVVMTFPWEKLREDDKPVAATGRLKSDAPS